MDISVYRGEYDLPYGNISSIVEEISNYGASLEPKDSVTTISNTTLKVSKARSIQIHVMLIADM